MLLWLCQDVVQQNKISNTKLPKTIDHVNR
jgi:hypothetical protein